MKGQPHAIANAPSATMPSSRPNAGSNASPQRCRKAVAGCTRSVTRAHRGNKSALKHVSIPQKPWSAVGLLLSFCELLVALLRIGVHHDPRPLEHLVHGLPLNQGSFLVTQVLRGRR